MRTHRFMVVLALVTGLTVASTTAAVASSAPVSLSFDKSISNPATSTWSGTVSGDISGDLTTQLLALDATGPIWHVEFDWIVDGSASFTARLSGTLHTETGRVVMNGTVISGDYLGAQVHEEGQLIDPATLRFTGLIRIFPATS
ncbi:MAG TPA: hypothetical protein VF071_02930 [Candidatus Limnocylindria bacterium]